MLVECQVVKPFLESDNGHLHQIGDASSVYLDVFCFRFQAGAVTLRTGCLASITCLHHAVLNLILILLEHLEELVDARLFFGASV